VTAPILAGVDGTGSGLDAVALAARLARATGDPLVVACVYPEGRRSSWDPAAVRGPAAKALEAARELADEAGPDYRTVASSSPARGLTELAEEEGAAMVVVGSHRGGAFGRVASGGTAERLLHGSGCPVAVAPRGYRRRVTDKLRRIGVAFVGTPDAQEAVRHAADLAARSGLPLALYSVVAVHHTWFVPEAVRPEEEAIPVEVRKEYQEALDQALAGLPEGVRATGELLYGESSTSSRWSASAASTCWSAAPGATARSAASCSAPSRRPWCASPRSRSWWYPGEAGNGPHA
jgi:nucleotide-binding universal stress UspA family protein